MPLREFKVLNRQSYSQKKNKKQNKKQKSNDNKGTIEYVDQDDDDRKTNKYKYLESRQTLFKWKIGMTRDAFSNPATATASHIYIERMMKKLANKF